MGKNILAALETVVVAVVYFHCYFHSLNVLTNHCIRNFLQCNNIVERDDSCSQAHKLTKKGSLFSWYFPPF